jgi:DNA-binding cell septation regulator SpoVG
MFVKVKSIHSPCRSGVLAHATVEIEIAGQRITVSDLRVLQNRNGEYWVAMPSQKIQTGTAINYQPIVEFSKDLKRTVEDQVLPAYSAWWASQGLGNGVGVRS